MEKKQNVPALRFQGFSGEWNDTRIEDIAGITYGGGTPSTGNAGFWQGTIPWIQSSDVVEDELWKVSPRKYISKEAVKSSATKVIPGNSIAIITRVGVGKLAFLPFDYATSQDFLSLSRLKINECFGTYAVWKKINADSELVQGTSIKGMTRDEVLSKIIKIPEAMDEARQVGRFFYQFDKKIRKIKGKIQKLQQFRQAMLTKLFPREGAEEPELRFRGFSGPWAQGVLGNVAKRVIVGLATSVTPYYRETGIPIFRNLNIKKNYLDDQDILFLDKEYADCQKSKQIHTDDVLTVHTGYIGISCVVPPKYDGCLTFTTLITTPDTTVLNGKYLSQYLNTPFGMESMQAVTTQGGRNNLNVNDFVKVVIKYPDLDEQIKIAEFLTSLDTYISLQQKKLKRMQRLKAALLEKMFV